MMDEMDMDAPPRKSESPKDISFKESFRRARTAGLDTFTHNGKKYTTEMATAKATPKAAVMDKPAPAKTAPAAFEQDKEIPRPPSEGRYKQDTYETPLKSAVRKYGSEVMDNLGKIVGGLGVAGGVAYGGSKLIDAARAADKGRATAALARANAMAAEKAAEKAAAKAAAKATAKKTPGTGKPVAASKARRDTKFNQDEDGVEFRRGGCVKMAKGGSVSSRADGCAQRGKTNCKIR